MRKVQFYHAGCPVCVEAERTVADALDQNQLQLEKVHLGTDPKRIAEAAACGVKSVPALVIGGQPFHINFGASLADLTK
jgi:glutaredoxin